MRIFSLAAVIFLAVAVVKSVNVNRLVDPDGFDDEADSEEVIFDDGDYFEDDDGNLVEIWDEPDDETIEQTEAQINERVFFHLYTRRNPTTSQQLVVGDDRILANSNWNPSRLTRIVTHGWLNSHESAACTTVRDAYLQNGDHNVIVVDWSRISRRSYGFAARRVGVVGRYIARLIDFLETRGLDISRLVVVGHSLGGHIAGLTALSARNEVGYVVALDPAGPYFWVSGPGNRVDKGDARNVQVIHTNGGKLGVDRAIGDIDFYPNGGKSQNGCVVDNTGVCSHARAFRFFAESINSRVGFWGQLCRTWRRFRYGRCSSSTTAFMGGNIPTNIPESGSYFLRTARSPDFALGPI